MKRKLLSMVLVAMVLIAGLIGCGRNIKTENEGTENKDIENVDIEITERNIQYSENHSDAENGYTNMVLVKVKAGKYLCGINVSIEDEDERDLKSTNNKILTKREVKAIKFRYENDEYEATYLEESKEFPLAIVRTKDENGRYELKIEFRIYENKDLTRVRTFESEEELKSYCESIYKLFTYDKENECFYVEFK